MKKIKQIFKFKPFSRKQSKILTWWLDNSPVKEHDGIIADGAIRSGKTLSMSLSFVMWSMETFNSQNFGMCGKTVGSFRRNVWFWLRIMILSRGYRYKDHKTENYVEITKGNKTNYFYIFGGKDEGSQDLIQGITLAGIFFDEVALMPESFVNQGTGRCSVEGSKYWFNCNPEGPMHWFKLNWIDKYIEKNMIYIRFIMDDNLSLTEKIKKRYKSMYTGLFFQRYILGIWAVAEGIIYDMFDIENEYIDGEGPDYDLWYRRYYCMDYGTINPCVFLEIIEQDDKYYVENEYYYNSRKERRQKDDAEYADDLLKFIDGKKYTTLIIDPSAASFKIAARRKGIRVKDANNDVLDGIRLVASLFALKILKVNKTKCPNVLAERSAYIWDEKAAKLGEEKPIKENDHAMDALRYYCKTIIKIVRGMMR